MARPDDMMLTYGVSLCDETKSVLFSKLLKVVSKNGVMSKVKRELRIDGDFHLEYLHTPLNMYMRVDSPSELPDAGQLRIIPVPPSQAADGAGDTISIASTVPVCQLESSLILVGQ